MKIIPLIFLLSLPNLIAQQLTPGEPLSATELAVQLDIKTWSIAYQTDYKITNISFALIFKSRISHDDLFTEKQLLGIGTEFREPLEKVDIKICASSDKTTLIFPGGSSAGAGFLQEIPSSTASIPEKNEAGRYVLSSSSFDSKSGSGPDNVKSTLELSITSK